MIQPPPQILMGSIIGRWAGEINWEGSPSKTEHLSDSALTSGRGIDDYSPDFPETARREIALFFREEELLEYELALSQWT
jgi:hypothetical protein